MLSSSVKTGYGVTPAETRESRQLISNKQFMLGVEKLYIIGEALAKKGLEIPVEIFYRNPTTNDNSFFIISHNKPVEIFKFNVIGYPSSSDYIEGMLKNAKYYNFFSTNYKISDVFLNLDAEGKNVILPYIDIVKQKLTIVGLGIFKKDKLVGELNIQDSKTYNMLSGTDGKGVISLLISPAKHLDCYVNVKRNVKVYKTGNQYKFVINLKFAGDLVSNTLYNKGMNQTSINSEIQTKLEESIKKECELFIIKLKDEYKVDALGLGKYGVAKYGRGMNIDWDDVFDNAKIEVNVKVKIDRIGRGNFLIKE